MKDTMSLTFFSLMLINTTFLFSSPRYVPSLSKYIQKPILDLDTKHENGSLLEHITRFIIRAVLLLRWGERTEDLGTEVTPQRQTSLSAPQWGPAALKTWTRSMV